MDEHGQYGQSKLMSMNEGRRQDILVNELSSTKVNLS